MEDLGNGIKFEMVEIFLGKFFMGFLEDELEWESCEGF